jgi:hypothetical protein
VGPKDTILFLETPLFPIFPEHNHRTGQCLVSYRIFLAKHLVTGCNLKNHVNILSIKSKMWINDREAL